MSIIDYTRKLDLKRLDSQFYHHSTLVHSRGININEMNRKLSSVWTMIRITSPIRMFPSSKIAFSSSIHTSSPRPFLDRISNFFNKQGESMGEEQMQKFFEAHMSVCSDPEVKKVTAEHYLEVIKEMRRISGHVGARENLPWVSNKDEYKELKAWEVYLTSLPDLKLKLPVKFKKTEIKMYAEKAGVSVESAMAVHNGVHNLQLILDFTKKRIAKGLPLPRTQKEMTFLMSTPGSGMSKKFSHPKWWMKNRYQRVGSRY